MPAKKKTDDEFVDEAVDNVSEFNRIRARAQVGKRKKTRVVDDFVLGPEDGFDPEVRVKFPLGIDKLRAYFYAQKDGDPFEQLRVVLGDYQFNIVWQAFADEEDSEDLIVGLLSMIADHIAGRGAGEIPGGSTRS